MSKNKIQKYFKLQREIDKLREKESELEHKQSQIFLKKCKTCSLYINAQVIFKVFLKNPTKEYDRWIVQHHKDCGLKWSKESLDGQINRIFKLLYEEEFIVRTGKGYYKLNPDYVTTVKRNKAKVKNDEK